MFLKAFIYNPLGFIYPLSVLVCWKTFLSLAKYGVHQKRFRFCFLLDATKNHPCELIIFYNTKSIFPLSHRNIPYIGQYIQAPFASAVQAQTRKLHGDKSGNQPAVSLQWIYIVNPFFHCFIFYTSTVQ